MTTVVAMQVVAKQKGNTIYSAFKDQMQREPVFYAKVGEIQPNRLFPGSVVTIEVPDCPKCRKSSSESVSGKCPCGFSWEDWISQTFKSVELPGEVEADAAKQQLRDEINERDGMAIEQ